MTRPGNPAAVIERYVAAQGLPASYARDAQQYYWPLVRRLVDMHPGPGFCVGVHGAQGTGKSTVAGLIAALLRAGFGMTVAVLSLDDLYLTRREREQLAEQIHPLLVTRGVPGTHDVELGRRVLNALRAGDGPVALPRFDKSVDDRAAESDWPVISAPVDVILFEGWCVATPPQPEAALIKAINALEQDEDPDGTWRRFVNAQLTGPYQLLFAELDWLMMLAAPDFDCVYRWRWQQELALVEKTGRPSPLLEEGALQRFIQHYERLTRHSLAVLPDIADAVVDLGEDHSVVGCRQCRNPP